VKQGGQTCTTTSTTTTSTTQPPYVYYVATRCDNPLLEQYFRTTGTYSAGESVRYNGYCWEIQALQGASGVDPDEGSYINCASCNSTFPTTTSTTSTTTTPAPSIADISINTNSSLDILLSISGITVNGVAVINVTGVDPNTPGNGGGCQTTELGTCNIIVPYFASTPGQSITLFDSNFTSFCENTGTGGGIVTFTGVTVNGSQPVNITAVEGACF
jgi:hypothetical protein